MSIIYSYPEQGALNANDMLIGTSAEKVGGKQKNITRNFSVQQIADFINGGAGFIDPVASDFQIAVFNQAGKKITGSIMSQDAFPNGTGITISGNLTTTGNITTPLNLTANGVVSLGGQANLISLNSVTKLGGPIQDATGTLGNVNQILLSNGSGVVTWQNYEAGLTYEGTWDALNNTTNGLSNSPALVQGVGVSGHFYIVNVEGTTSLGPGLNDWHVGDWAIFLDEGGQPASWQKIDNTSTLVGSGTAGTFAKWTNATTLNDSIMSESGTVVSVDGDLKVKDTIQATTTNSNLKLKGNGTGGVEIMSADGVTDGKITLNCSQNSHGVTLQSPPHASGATYTLVLPTNFGGAGDVLTSAGANPSQLVWTTPTTGTVTGTGTENYVTKWSAGGTGIQNSTIFDNGTNVGIGTTSPSAPLEVLDSLFNDPGLKISASSANFQAELNLNRLATNRAARITYALNGANQWFAGVNYNAGNPVNDYSISTSDNLGSIPPSFLITSSGNVGIGTTSPSAKLEVAGDIRGTESLIVKDTGGTKSLSLLRELNYATINNGAETLNYNALNHIFLTGLNERMRIDSAGNVGIGTSTPASLLSVRTAGISGDQDFATFSRGTSTEYEVLKISRSAGSTNFLAEQNITLSADYNNNHTGVNSNIVLKTDNTERMRIDSSGNVGIGIDSPSAKLDVAAEDPVIRITNTKTNLVQNDVIGGLEFFTKDASVGASRVLSAITSSNTTSSATPSGNLIFKTSTGGGGAVAATEKMRIDSSGNVGIGTTSPAVSLDISATDAVQMPVGVTGDRPTTGVSNGMLRYNSTNNGFEGYINGNWGDIGGGASGGLVFRGTFDASTGAIASGGSLYTCPAGGSGGTVDTAIGDLYIVTTAGSFFCSGTSLNVGDEVICITAATAGLDNVNNWNAIASGAGGAVTGSGTTNYVPKFTGATVVGNSSIFNDASGNVGIGTANPSSSFGETTLDVTESSGDASLSLKADSTKAFEISSRSGDVLLYDMYGRDLRFGTGGNEKMRIDSLGNVGIGTTSPVRSLNVNSGNQQISALIESTSSLSSQINIKNSNSNNGGFVKTTGDNIILSANNSGLSHLVVADGGNVGIGTDSPVSALHVSTTVNEVLTLQSITSSQKIKFNDINNPADDSDFGSVSGDLAMFTNSSGTPNTQSFTFNKDGKLGIGQFSTSPQANLDISDLNFNPSLRLYGANTGSELKIEVSNFFGNFNTTINSAQNDLIFQGNNSAIMSLGVSGSSPSLPTGSLRLNQYGQGNKTGTAVYNLTVDGFGNVIEDPISGGASATITSNQTTTSNATTTVFLLGATPNGNSVNFVDVFIDGVYQETTTYSVSGASFDEITFNSPVPSGVTVETKTTADYNVGAAVDTVSLGQSNTTGNVDLRINPIEVTSGTTEPGAANSLYIFTATAARSIATVTLPGSPTLGDSIKISNLGGLANVLGANGNKIMGVAQDLTINTPTAAFEIIWSGSNNGWIIIGNV